ncbi:MAG: dethiobiotin synthase [Deltaproteobacteria bacterium]|nr:dethiobiotin synthase [Deltaproteobacteria bacterium]
MTRTIFITGTGTDVGKTIVTRALVRALVNRRVRLNAVKPVESGVPIIDGNPAPPDGTALIRAAKTCRSMAQTCRYMFRTPVSPHLAARLEQESIDEGALHHFIQEASSDCDLLVAEGAGGLLVPLNDSTLYADFIARTRAELLIITPDILGAINNTLLTIEAARHRQIPIVGVILNQGPNRTLENAEAIGHFGNTPVLGTFPTADTQADDDTLAAAAEAHLHLDIFVKDLPK